MKKVISKFFGIVAMILFIQCKSAYSQSQKPNVVLILTDDQGWGDLSLHGNPVLETKNLDNLANEGTRLNNFYVSPLCAPTRAGILTGRYHLQTGVVSVSNGLEIMDTDETTLAELFKANGYQTGAFGKWHNGAHYPNRPNDQGFNEFIGFTEGHLSNYFNTGLNHNGKKAKTRGYITDVLTDEAIQFIDKNKEKPFFCYVPYNAPHSPFQVPDKYFNKYKGKNLDDELATVYGMLESVDDNVGRLLKYLKDKNLEENTIVIFMTDNGPNGVRYNGVMRGIKGSVHEGGMRVPFFIKWPGKIKSQKLEETLTANIDIYPTLLELCQLKPIATKPLYGISFASLLLEKPSSTIENRKIFTNVNFMQIPASLNLGGFRDNQYRYVYEQNKNQLFYLKTDPSEQNNLAKKEPQLTSKYESDYKQWFASATAELTYKNPVILSAEGTELPSYEATVTTGLKYKEGHGWAHDWIAKWPSTNDSLYWLIDCKKTGKYQLEIEYLCSKANKGSNLLVRVGDQQKRIKLRKRTSELIHSPDRVKRKEAYEVKKWGKLNIGDFYVLEGKHQITIKAGDLVGNNVMEFNQLIIKYAE